MHQSAWHAQMSLCIRNACSYHCQAEPFSPFNQSAHVGSNGQGCHRRLLPVSCLLYSYWQPFRYCTAAVPDAGWPGIHKLVKLGLAPLVTRMLYPTCMWVFHEAGCVAGLLAALGLLYSHWQALEGSDCASRQQLLPQKQPEVTVRPAAIVSSSPRRR